VEVEKLKELLKFLESSGFEEVEIETKDLKLKAKLRTSKEEAKKSQKEEKISEQPKVHGEKEEKNELPPNYHVVKSPMVGTFYRAPHPGAEPFVKEGDRVEKGQVLCIIEALKVMNEIESDVSGIVRKILVENGEPVEYDQPLFYIEKV
jgi:acetyl-CoA carboxylase biotin carboxyl carrier protein